MQSAFILGNRRPSKSEYGSYEHQCHGSKRSHSGLERNSLLGRNGRQGSVGREQQERGIDIAGHVHVRPRPR